MDEAREIQLTKKWVEAFVIHFGLCPFAKKPALQGRIHYVLTKCQDLPSLRRSLLQEAFELWHRSEFERATTILIHPWVLTDFEDYLSFLEEMELPWEKAGLSGNIQIAGFHPNYQFDGANPEAAQHYTNRSPFPMLHLIREDQLEQALKEHPAPESIPEKNIELLEEMGKEKVMNHLKKILQ